MKSSHGRSLSLISKERRVSKRRLLKLAEESSSSSAEDDASVIAAQPMNVAVLAKFGPRPSINKRKRDYDQGPTFLRATRAT